MSAKWRWLPLEHPEYESVEANPRYFLLFHAPLILAFAGFFFLPPVQRAFGIPPVPIAVALGLHLVNYGVMVFARVQQRLPVAWDMWVALVNTATSSLPALLTGRPTSVLWALYFVYPHVSARAVGLTVYNVLVFFLVPVAGGAVWQWRGGAALAETAPALLTVGASAALFYGLLARGWVDIDEARRLRDERARHLAVEKERARVAGDIHTTLGAALTEISLWLQVAAVAGGEAASEALARARARTRGAREELGLAAENLERAEMAPAQLERMLRERLASLFEAGRVELRLELRAGDEPVGFPVAYHAQKLVEEAALNAVRHASPRAVRVELDLGEHIRVAVSDDGAGFDVAAAAPARGLRQLAEHAEALGVPLSISSAPGQGTRVLASQEAGGGGR